MLNVLGLRFANRVFEPIWNCDHIERVDIVFDEKLGLEGRAGYYDKAGALIDMVQSHLLQVLAMVAMDPVPSASATCATPRRCAARDPVWDDDPARQPARATRRVGRRPRVPGYADEQGVDPLAARRRSPRSPLEIDNWRWAGVPFTLRSGKALRDAARRSW